jgi:hypothetical protein
MTIPTVPQTTDSPTETARREALLKAAQQKYVYDNDPERPTAPSAIAAEVPSGEGFTSNPKWLLLVAKRAAQLFKNAAETVFDAGSDHGLSRGVGDDVTAAHADEEARLLEMVGLLERHTAPPAPEAAETAGDDEGSRGLGSFFGGGDRKEDEEEEDPREGLSGSPACESRATTPSSPPRARASTSSAPGRGGTGQGPRWSR